MKPGFQSQHTAHKKMLQLEKSARWLRMCIVLQEDSSSHISHTQKKMYVLGRYNDMQVFCLRELPEEKKSLDN